MKAGGNSENIELERLRAAESLLRSIAANAPDFILQFDREGTISYMNRPAPGFTLEQMIGSNVRRWMEKESHEDFGRTVDCVFETALLSSYESVGSVSGRCYINRVSPVIENGRVTSAILITHDVTELKEAERSLRESDARYRALVDASFEGVAISVEGRVVAANPAMAAMFGCKVEELIGLSAADLTTAESSALVAKRIAEEYEAPYEIVAMRRNGTTFPCEALGRGIVYSGQPARITGLRDLSERHRQTAERARLEERLHQAQKLETLGLLAGGIAHDFNNLLNVILGSLELAWPAPDDPADLEKNLEQARLAALRAGDLTQQLLVYAGRGRRQTQALNLNAMLTEVVDMLRVSLAGNVEFELSLDRDLPLVQADIAQCRQVAMNLIINASEARKNGKGTVRIQTGALEADERFLLDCVNGGDALPGHYVFMEVADDGVGMDAATLSRVFDPFFTTKTRGRGLGLASVQGILRAHKGAVRVSTTVDRGTTFSILLPLGRPNTAPAP